MRITKYTHACVRLESGSGALVIDLPIHDGQVNERGLGSINGWLAHAAGDGYRYLAPGETA